jgi:hypothetical protein
MSYKHNTNTNVNICDIHLLRIHSQTLHYKNSKLNTARESHQSSSINNYLQYFSFGIIAMCLY